jgi:hypothetical protein
MGLQQFQHSTISNKIFVWPNKLQGTSKNSIKVMMARRKQAKKRSLQMVNEHFELVFNAASVPSVDF